MAGLVDSLWYRSRDFDFKSSLWWWSSDLLWIVFEKCFRRKEAIIAISSHTEFFSHVRTISHQKTGEGTSGVVSVVHIKTLDSFCVLKGEKHSCQFNAISEARGLQSLAGYNYSWISIKWTLFKADTSLKHTVVSYMDRFTVKLFQQNLYKTDTYK